jgi:hypothetical protein
MYLFLFWDFELTSITSGIKGKVAPMSKVVVSYVRFHCPDDGGSMHL